MQNQAKQSPSIANTSALPPAPTAYSSSSQAIVPAVSYATVSLSYLLILLKNFKYKIFSCVFLRMQARRDNNQIFLKAYRALEMAASIGTLGVIVASCSIM